MKTAMTAVAAAGIFALASMLNAEPGSGLLQRLRLRGWRAGWTGSGRRHRRGNCQRGASAGLRSGSRLRALSGLCGRRTGRLSGRILGTTTAARPMGQCGRLFAAALLLSVAEFRVSRSIGRKRAGRPAPWLAVSHSARKRRPLRRKRSAFLRHQFGYHIVRPHCPALIFLAMRWRRCGNAFPRFRYRISAAGDASVGLADASKPKQCERYASRRLDAPGGWP